MNISDTLSRLDLRFIAGMVPEGAKVLDVGCGDGDLLALIQETRKADARGLEISPAGVSRCVARGLSVVQGDGNHDLAEYPDKGFDYIILTRTIQAMKRPDRVIREALRIGEHVIVSFPNFGYWRVRAKLLLTGRMPRSRALPLEWYATPNIHLCTIRDFVDFCKATSGVNLTRAYAVGRNAAPSEFDAQGRHLAQANLLSEEAIFLIQ